MLIRKMSLDFSKFCTLYLELFEKHAYFFTKFRKTRSRHHSHAVNPLTMNLRTIFPAKNVYIVQNISFSVMLR